MKKVYQQPMTASIEVCPQSILCGSSGYTNPNLPSGGSGSGVVGG